VCGPPSIPVHKWLLLICFRNGGSSTFQGVKTISYRAGAVSLRLWKSDLLSKDWFSMCPILVHNNLCLWLRAPIVHGQLMRAYDSSNGALGAGLRSATFARSTLKPTPVSPLVPVNPRPRPALAVVPSVLRVKDPAPAPVIDRTRRWACAPLLLYCEGLVALLWGLNRGLIFVIWTGNETLHMRLVLV
jgi:hypothetical protein